MTSTVPVDRSRLPEPGPAPAFHFPQISRSILANGLRVWSVRHVSIPVATVMLLVRRGAADDPAGKEGLAAITVDMLDEGTGGMSSIQVHEALGRMGAQLDSDIGPDAALLTVTILSRFLEPAVQLLADIATRPSLTDDDFSRVRQLRLHRLMQLRDMPGAVADRAFLRLLYGQHPYGHMPLGSDTSLSSLTADDVRDFHRGFLRPDDAFLIVAGDCNHAEVEAVAARAFQGWLESAGTPLAGGVELPAHVPLSVIARAGAPQSELRIGHVAAARNTPDYHSLIAANMVLGGQFVSRINLNLREEKGFTYGARTSFDFRRMPGPFSLQVSVQTAATAEAVHESIREIAALRDSRPVTSEELSLAVAALTRGYSRNFETAEQLARAATQLALYDLPDAYFDEFVPKILAITVDDVTRAARQYLHPDRLTTLIVGDYGVIGTDLPGLGLGTPAIRAANDF
jgi:predicted Zn-dependent peptidase